MEEGNEIEENVVVENEVEETAKTELEEMEDRYK